MSASLSKSFGYPDTLGYDSSGAVTPDASPHRGQPLNNAATLDPGAILNAIGAAAYRWDIQTDAMVWSDNARQVLGAPANVSLGTGRDFVQLIEAGSRAVRDQAFSADVMRDDDGTGIGYRIEYPLRVQNAAGPQLWVEDSGRWFAGADGKPSHALGALRPINERHARDEQLTRMARTDALTGEMNRLRLTDVLAETIENAVRLRSSCGFLLVAIDNLAGLNQAYGYDVTEELIAGVAQRIRSKLRSRDHLGRYSGNKFGIILNDCTPDDMIIAADRLLADLREEVIVTSAGPIAVTATMGGVTAPRHARTLREVLSRAQEALDSAKSRRRGSFQPYRPDVAREARRMANISVTDEIVSALNERRVFVMYEPVVDIHTRQPAFYECLMRVRRHDGTLVPAQDVIPAAERLGLVRLLDHRVLALVLEELRTAPTLRASLNVSPPSIIDPDWWSGLAAMLRAHAGIAQRLTVEITETAAIHDIDETRGFVARVKDLGARIAIDDFGAGYTSFRNLRKLGVDMVKIDGAFVQNITRSEDDRAFVRSLIDLARRLGLTTVAEWVQDEAATKMLDEWGCNYIQGALIGLASTERQWLTSDDSARSA